eukprot:1156292-Pelagomonas_calceolata.AAC.6
MVCHSVYRDAWVWKEVCIGGVRPGVESKANESDTSIGELRHSLETQLKDVKAASTELQQSLGARADAYFCNGAKVSSAELQQSMDATAEGVEAALDGLRQTDAAKSEQWAQQMQMVTDETIKIWARGRKGKRNGKMLQTAHL